LSKRKLPIDIGRGGRAARYGHGVKMVAAYGMVLRVIRSKFYVSPHFRRKDL
jgi:hypothetical protein